MTDQPTAVSKQETEQTDIDEWQALADEVSNLYEQSQNTDFDLSSDTRQARPMDKPKPSN